MCHQKLFSQRKVFWAANGEKTAGKIPEKGDNVMNFREKMKRFWTLDVHNHEGFTLVELIIVIAILAILSTGAIAGYSVYVEQANRTTDEALAAEIKNALVLAMYSGELTSGDYVVIKQGETASWGNGETENDANSTIYKAMAAAYGSGWENALKLKWDGWTVGVAGDAEKMDMVYNSNFSPAKMDKLLDQLQGVVGDAAEYLGGGSINVSTEIAALMQQNGFDIEAGATLDSTTSMAAANAYVFLVAGELGGYDVQLDDGEMSEEGAAFMQGWYTNNFEGTSMDPVSAAAAKYASVLALAKYVDSKAGTSYESQLNISDDPRDDADIVLAAIQNSTDEVVENALSTYRDGEDGEIGVFYNDAMAFLTYMQGVSDSSDNLLQNTDLGNGQYFVDGYVFNYVNSYLSISDVLAAGDFDGSAMAFFCVDGDIVCMFSESND